MSSVRQGEYEIPAGFGRYVVAAVTRLSYLMSNITFAVEAERIVYASEQEIECAKLEREIAHALYREKIYAETLEMRRSLIEALTRP